MFYNTELVSSNFRVILITEFCERHAIKSVPIIPQYLLDTCTFKHGFYYKDLLF